MIPISERSCSCSCSSAFAERDGVSRPLPTGTR
jgi:hypothetical protein